MGFAGNMGRYCYKEFPNGVFLEYVCCVWIDSGYIRAYFQREEKEQEIKEKPRSWFNSLRLSFILLLFQMVFDNDNLCRFQNIGFQVR